MSVNRLIGSWRGTYQYSQAPQIPPVIFNATFEQGERPDEFVGSIMDESPLQAVNVAGDFHAQIAGRIDGDRVQFVKSYRANSAQHLQLLSKRITQDEVHYTGTISGDNRQMQGEWVIRKYEAVYYGAWSAERTWPPLTPGSENSATE